MVKTFDQILKELTVNDIAIDLGANVGQESIPMAQTGATVYAFEPDRAALKLLKKRSSGLPNLHIEQRAAWDIEEKLRLYLRETPGLTPLLATQSSSIVADKTTITRELFYEIETIDIGGFISRLNAPIKLLKVDIEGAEYRVLNRIFDLDLQGRIETIFVEMHVDRIPGYEVEHFRLLERIRNLGIKNIDTNWA